jgi:peptidoglycan/xylan/chitin deacetylase (PgdA/CDA1 family)
MSSGIPVLMYHALTANNITSSGKKNVAVSVKAFRTQMHWLHTNGYRTLNAQQVENYLKRNSLPYGKYCMLTFDDGYLSWHRYARDILAEYSFTATAFISTAYINELYDLPDFSLDEADRPLTWEEIKDLSDQGWSIQAHGHYHHRWANLPTEDLAEDIFICKNLIEQHIGTPVNYVAYPYGVYSSRTLRLLDKIGVSAGYSVHDGMLTPSADILRLPRIEINSLDTIASFQNKVCTGYASGTRAIASRLRDLIYANPKLKDIIKGVVS